MRVCPECNCRTTAEHCPNDNRPTVEEDLLRLDPAQDPFLGMTIDGKYLIEERLGRGAMAGGVYRARHAGTGGFVAIKLVRTDLVPDESFIRRFYVEAQNTHKLHHPNTVRVSDFGRTRDGVLYLVMEYLPGRVLASVLEKEAPLPTARVVHIIEQVLKSLGEAHSLGMVHRDVKPENVMLLDQFGEPDFVKVLDFGIARSLNAGGVGTRGAIGTPEFMSPEQWEGKSIDGRADLYAVGCMMYEMLGGRLPFERERGGTEEVVVCMTAHLTKMPDPLIDVCPWVPKALSQLVMELLAKKAQDRPANADEVLRRLNAIKASGVLSDHPPPRSGPRPKPAATTPSPSPVAEGSASPQGPSGVKAEPRAPGSGKRETPGASGHPESGRSEMSPGPSPEPPPEKTAIIEVAPSSERPNPEVSQDPNAATLVIDAARENQSASSRHDEARSATPPRKKPSGIREPAKAVAPSFERSPGALPDVRNRDTRPVPARTRRIGAWLWAIAAILLVFVMGGAGAVVAVYAYSDDEEPASASAQPASVGAALDQTVADSEEASPDIFEATPVLDVDVASREVSVARILKLESDPPGASIRLKELDTELGTTPMEWAVLEAVSARAASGQPMTLVFRREDGSVVERMLDTNLLTSGVITVRFSPDGGVEGPADDSPPKAAKRIRHVKRGVGKGVELPKLRLDRPGSSNP